MDLHLEMLNKCMECKSNLDFIVNEIENGNACMRVCACVQRAFF